MLSRVPVFEPLDVVFSLEEPVFEVIGTEAAEAGVVVEADAVGAPVCGARTLAEGEAVNPAICVLICVSTLI